MNIYLLPDNLIQDIERMINAFWWGGGNNNNNGGANRNGVSSSSPMLDPSHDVYAAASSGVGGLLGGSAYGNQIN
jgi:hypothetical protein